MDPITLIGVVLAFIIVMVVLILEGGSPTSILLLAPLILVFGGTFAVGAAGMSGKLFVSAIKAAGKALVSATPKYESLLETLVDCANIARRDGLLSLEATVSEIEDPLLKRGLELAIDGTDPGDDACSLRSGGTHDLLEDAEMELASIRDENTSLMEHLVSTKVRLAEVEGDFLESRRALLRSREKQMQLARQLLDVQAVEGGTRDAGAAEEGVASTVKAAAPEGGAPPPRERRRSLKLPGLDSLKL